MFSNERAWGNRSAFIPHYSECMITSSSFPPQREVEYPLTTHQFIIFSSLNGLRNALNGSTVAKGTRPLLFRSTTIISRASTFTHFHPSFTLNSRLPALRPSHRLVVPIGLGPVTFSAGPVSIPSLSWEMSISPLLSPPLTPHSLVLHMISPPPYLSQQKSCSRKICLPKSDHCLRPSVWESLLCLFSWFLTI